MGTMRQRRPGVWQIRVSAGFDSQGRRRVVTETFHGSERAAATRMARIVTQVDKGDVPNAVTLGQILDDYMGRDTLARSTRDKCTFALKHLPPAWRRRRVDKITSRDIQNLYTSLRQDGVSASTVRSLHETCRAAVNLVVRLGDLDRNPFTNATPPPPPRSRATAPDLDIIHRLRTEAARNPLHAVLFEVALMTGARRAEVLALRWSALRGDRLTISEALEVDGTLKTTKTGQTRVVTVPASTVAIIQAWQDTQRQIALECAVPLAPDPFLVSSEPDGSVPWRPSSATQLFSRLRARAGVGPVRLHDLRHGAASQLLAGGMDAVSVAARLGHADPRTTMRIYGHVIVGRDRDASQMLDNLYRVTPPDNI
jgi:integrase